MLKIQINSIKILSLSATFTGLLVFAFFAISIFTLLTSLMGTMTPGEGQEPIKIEISPKGETIFTLKAVNSGLLAITTKLNIKLISKDKVVAQGQKAIKLLPKEKGELKLRLAFTKSQMEELQETPPKISFSLETRTFFDLAGMGVSAQMGEDK